MVEVVEKKSDIPDSLMRGLSSAVIHEITVYCEQWHVREGEREGQNIKGDVGTVWPELDNLLPVLKFPAVEQSCAF